MTAAQLTEELAGRLWQAETSKVPVRPLTDDHPELGVADAYAIQMSNVERRMAAGVSVRGHKLGLTARAMQEMFGVYEPDFGHLLGDMFYPEASDLPTSHFIQPRVEIETAFILGRRLAGPGVTVADAIRAVEYVIPCFEIIDSRIVDWRIRLADTIADNGSSSGVVLGGRPRRLTDVDLRSTPASLHVNDREVESGSTAAVLGNPLTALVWLANTLGRLGVTLEEGHVVLPGTCCRAVSVAPGDRVRGSFAGLGDVEVTFVQEMGA